MMTSEAKVGATAIAGISLMIAMILFLSGVSFGDKGYPVNAIYSNVNGLQPGAAVSFAGVNIGTVKSVGIIPEGVKVEMLIDPKIKIPKDALFNISATGLMGEQFVSVTYGPKGATEEYLSPNDTIVGQNPHGFDQLMQLSSETVKSINDILSDENVKIALKHTAMNVNELTANLSALTQTMAKLAANNEAKINDTITNLALMAESLKSLVERMDIMSADIDNNGQTARELKEIVHNVRNTSARVERMAASLESVVANEETAQDLREIIKNTKNVSEKADQMLGGGSYKTSTELEMLYDPQNNNYSGGAYFKIGRENSNSFALIGVSGIGDDNRFNFQYGRNSYRWSERMGIIDGKIGMGADYHAGEKWKFSLDVFDPNDVKYKLRAKYNLKPDLAIIGQYNWFNDREISRQPYFGVQRIY